MLVNDLLKQATEKLEKKGIASATLDAEVLLSYVLKKSREYLCLNPDQALTVNQTKKFSKLIQRRLKFEPVAYLIQTKEFYGLDFYVDKRVLIPRPETELLVETIVKFFPQNTKQTIVDIGTGSGCIAVALAKKLPKARIIAIDLSAGALSVAKKNAKQNEVFQKIRFIKSDLLSKVNEPIDLLVANLPYLSDSDLNSGIEYEPYQALVAKRKGKECFEKLLTQVPNKLNSNGTILLEIHPPLLKYIQALAKLHFPKATIVSEKDLAGKNRVVIISNKDNITSNSSRRGFGGNTSAPQKQIK